MKNDLSHKSKIHIFAIKYGHKIAFAMALIAMVWGLNHWGVWKLTSPELVQEWVQDQGQWGPIAYLMLFTFVPLTLFPDAVLAMAGGMSFGMIMGAFYTWLGALFGGSLAFWIARLLGQEAIDKILPHKLKEKHAIPKVTGFVSILVLRLIPLVPFDVISYGAGMSSVRYRDFLGATAVGIIPGVVVYVNLGDKLFDWRGPSLGIAIGCLVLLMAASGFGVRFLKEKHDQTLCTEPENERTVQ